METIKQLSVWPLKQQPQKMAVIGLDLGNNLTTLYFNQNFYQFHTQLSIDLGKKEIIYGREPQSLKQKLLIKSNRKQKLFPNECQESPVNMAPEKTVIIDFLDLFVKYQTFKNLAPQKQNQNNADFFSKKLPECFQYYRHEFKQTEDGSVQIILSKGDKVRKGDPLVRRDQGKNERLHLQENSDVIQKTEEQSIRLEQCIYLFIKSIINEVVFGCLSENDRNQSKQILQIQVVVNEYGFEKNPYLASLSKLESIFSGQSESRVESKKTNISFIHSTTSLALYFYLAHLKTPLESPALVACLDFGARGLTFSVFKLHPQGQCVLETLEHFTHQFGGIDITRIIVDVITSHVKLNKGVDIKSNPEMVQQLYILAEETKIALTQAQQIYVRIQGYPLQQPYGFYLRRSKLQLKIGHELTSLIDSINQICIRHSQSHLKISTIITSGQSFDIPLFKSKFMYLVIQKNRHKKTDIHLIRAQKFWVSKGNCLYKQSGVVLLQKSLSQICVKGDEDYHEKIIAKGGDLPVRLIKQMQFPRDQLTFTLKFYQDQLQIAVYVIELKNLRWGQNFNFVAQKQQNKPLAIYSTKFLGQILIQGNNFCKKFVLNQSFSQKNVLKDKGTICT